MRKIHGTLNIDVRLLAESHFIFDIEEVCKDIREDYRNKFSDETLYTSMKFSLYRGSNILQRTLRINGR